VLVCICTLETLALAFAGGLFIETPLVITLPLFTLLFSILFAILFVLIHAIRDEARSAAERKRTAAGKAVQTE
jgi:hypothetical protein